MSRILEEAIAAAAARGDQADAAFLRGLDDGRGGIKPFPVLEDNVRDEDPRKVRAAHARLVGLGMLREQLDPMSPPREIPTMVRELVRHGRHR